MLNFPPFNSKDKGYIDGNLEGLNNEKYLHAIKLVGWLH